MKKNTVANNGYKNIVRKVVFASFRHLASSIYGGQESTQKYPAFHARAVVEYIQLKADQNGYATNVALALSVHVFHLPAKPNCFESI